ncbi:MAG: response regulator [Campylobacterales bacterium]|nr:response regulator [Campylobacterales bacterium]
MDGLKKLNLLFLEDNEEFARNIIEFLNIYFKEVFHSTTIKKALELFNDNKIDIIISDIKVEDGNGLVFIKSVRQINNEIPIVILSAHKDEDFLFKAIPLNIFAYELKPLRYDKFIELLKMLSSKFESKKIMSLKKGFAYDFKKRELYVNAECIKLTKKETFFVELMMQNIDEMVTIDMIQRNVWQENFMSDSAIKNLVFRLRKKVGFDFISTVSCLGYKLESISL